MPEPDISPLTGQQPTVMTAGHQQQRWRWVGYGLVALLLGLVFSLYLQPGIMVTLAEQLWACF
jgi:succinylglutamate desuccinylase